MPKAVVAASIDIPLAVELERRAQERKTTISAIVIEALTQYFQSNDVQAQKPKAAKHWSRRG